MAVYENSRYLHSQMYYRSGFDVPVLDIRGRFSFNESLFRRYRWQEGDTLDGISVKYYGLTAFRWAILDANPQYSTEFDIKSGDIINIPDYEEVVNIVNV